MAQASLKILESNGKVRAELVDQIERVFELGLETLAGNRAADPVRSRVMIEATQLETSPDLGVAGADTSVRLWRDADPVTNRGGTTFRRIHLVWADKVGLVVAFVIAVFCVLVCAAALVAAETVTFWSLNHVLIAWSGMAELTIALPIWLVMRGIDFATNGPAHRRADPKPRIK